MKMEWTMGMQYIFTSSIGMYVSQSFFHSLITALIVNYSISIWKITDPSVSQRFRFIVIAFPVFSFYFYHIIDPYRTCLSFRADSLFDSTSFFSINLWGMISMQWLFLVILAVTSIIFIFQELIPIIRHIYETRKYAGEKMEEDGRVNELKYLNGKVRLIIIDDKDFTLYSRIGKNSAIYLSGKLINTLTKDELDAVIGHERAHIKRSKRPYLFIMFFLRIINFFNPVILIEFRRMLEEEEMICDDAAVRMTGRSLELASALEKIYMRETGGVENTGGIYSLKRGVQEYTHRMVIKRRKERLSRDRIDQDGERWFEFILTLIAVTLINYFII